MKQEINAAAPLFKKIDIFDRKVDITDLKGKKILLAFFRHAGCPFCNLRVHALTKEHSELKKHGLEMIFVFESMKRVILRSTFHKEVSPIPLIADPEKELYTMYGLENSSVKSVISHLTTFIPTVIRAARTKVPVHLMSGNESFSTIPAEFLIDREGIIREMHYSASLTDRMDIRLIHDFART